jgi:BatD DUF11 like domain
MSIGTGWKYLAALAAALLALSSSAAAAVQLELDRTRITEGETVTLTFHTDDARQSLEADFSALEQDFEILDRRSETQLSIVNGRQAALVRLLLTLEPRRSGELTIPALDFGGSRTESVVLRVDPAPQLAAGELPPVFIEVEITPEQGPYYVHAQLGLIVRVFYQQNLTEAAISQPEPAPASVRLLQETPYQAERGGERYRVLERRYAIFPERSGELTLPAMQLSGRLVERRNSSIWQPSVRGRRVTVASEPLQVTIQPRPAAFTGADWQPARAYSVEQQISSSDAVRVGEPVTRTIIIDAVGLEENMIAEPAWPDLPGARIYPDQPQGISRDDGQWVLGHKEFRYAVVPEQAGELVLPELTVHWWDTEHDRQQTAVLPAKALQVAPSALVPPPAAVVPAPSASSPAAAGTGAPGTLSRDGAAGAWRWLALLFATLWLLTLAAAWRWRGQPRTVDTPVTPGRRGAVNEPALLEAIHAACKVGQPAAARRALLAWLRDFGPGKAAGSLLEFAAASGDGALRQEIYQLDAKGFRESAAGAWDGPAFWSAFEAWRKAWRAARDAQRPALTDLYAPANRYLGSE